MARTRRTKRSPEDLPCACDRTGISPSMRSASRRVWLVLSFLFGCVMLRAQSITPIDPSINVQPSDGSISTLAPQLSGIQGGGMVERGQNVILTVHFFGRVPE